MTIRPLAAAVVACLGASAVAQSPEPGPSPGVAQPGEHAPVTGVGGLVLQDLVIGKGQEIKKGDAVVVHYMGTLKADGREFDSSHKRNAPSGFGLHDGPGGVIKGWVEGVPGMRVGGKRRLTIPADLAYGEKEIKDGETVLIPANSDLVFEIEVLGVMNIEDINVGDGPEVKRGGAAVFHYRGTLKADGTEFDSSYARGAPVAFPLPNLIKGWQEGIPGMKVGGKRKLTIPAALAYGAAARPKIPVNSDLVFEIEVLDVLETVDERVGDGAEVGFPARGRPAPVVRVHYRGTLAEGGKEFDSSYERGEPIEFGLDGVIQGWTWGIPGMKVGGKRKLVIPWQMAYGETGFPPDIPPRARLVFEVELLHVR